MHFLSERNIEMHKSYLNDLMLKYSIFEKSYPDIRGKDIDGIYRVKIPMGEREAAARLYSEILAHKIYFDSFGDRNSSSDRVKSEFGSVGQFLYEISEKSNECDTGFLLVYDYKNKLYISCGAEYEKILRYRRALLALDLCEHAYFYDYGFNKRDYVMNAISYFDLNRI